MNIKPIGKRVVLKSIKVEDKTSSGIILTDKEVEKPEFAEVMEISAEVKYENSVKVGDKVIYTKYKGTKVKDGEDEYIVIDFEDILAVIQN